MSDEIDLEALLAAAARRLSKLGYEEAAVALADSTVASLTWSDGGLDARVRLIVGSDHFDALKEADIWAQELRYDEDGDEYWAPSVV